MFLRIVRRRDLIGKNVSNGRCARSCFFFLRFFIYYFYLCTNKLMDGFFGKEQDPGQHGEMMQYSLLKCNWKIKRKKKMKRARKKNGCIAFRIYYASFVRKLFHGFWFLNLKHFYRKLNVIKKNIGMFAKQTNRNYKGGMMCLFALWWNSATLCILRVLLTTATHRLPYIYMRI